MILESLTVKGHLTIKLFDEHGNLKDYRDIDNLVVQTGRNLIASAFSDNTIPLCSHMACGTGTTAPVLANTTLETEVARVALTSTTRTNNTVTFEATFPPTIGTGAITEAGIFNAETAGSMLNRATFPVVNKQSADTLTIMWNVTIN